MKNLVYAAVLAALGYNMVSCDADGIDSITSGSTNKKNPNKVSSIVLKETDTISINDSLITNLVEDPGPGDDPIIVPPPPPKP